MHKRFAHSNWPIPFHKYIPGNYYFTLLTFSGAGFWGVLDLAAKVGKILNTRMGSELESFALSLNGIITNIAVPGERLSPQDKTKHKKEPKMVTFVKSTLLVFCSSFLATFCCNIFDQKPREAQMKPNDTRPENTGHTGKSSRRFRSKPRSDPRNMFWLNVQP